jgi:hypothetical protein
MNLNELFIQSGMYNLNSSDSERRKKIEAILLKGRKGDEDNEEDEMLDDEQINQYIRRSEVHSLLCRRSMRSSTGWTSSGTRLRRISSRGRGMCAEVVTD